MNKIILILILLAVLTGLVVFYFHSRQSFQASDAATRVQTGSFELNLTPDQALPLFTAPGEEVWISHWKPVILNGDGFEKGTVFTMSHHMKTSYWIVMDYDIHAHRALYVRTIPGQDTGYVDVQIKPNGQTGSLVQVTYQLTGLSAAGNRKLQTLLNKENYDDMMKSWKKMILNNQAEIEDFLARKSLK